jgi:hypothetical protein
MAAWILPAFLQYELIMPAPSVERVSRTIYITAGTNQCTASLQPVYTLSPAQLRKVKYTPALHAEGCACDRGSGARQRRDPLPFHTPYMPPRTRLHNQDKETLSFGTLADTS